MNWSPQQVAALAAVDKWLAAGHPQVFRLFGFAGTGKTTLAKDIAERAKGKVLFGAFTGKAALVLRSKGCRGARTIHSMIYKPVDGENGEPTFVLDPGSEVAGAKLVIIDECSMVGAELGRDLLSFGVPVLVLGDPAQLPPVKDAGFFTNGQPDIMLSEVHRQAADNPIIRLSMDVREERRLPSGTFGSCQILSRQELPPNALLTADQVLVGMNRTRQTINQQIRALRGFNGDLPNVGEKLVCLRNNRDKGLLNGGLWIVESVGRASKKNSTVNLTVRSEDAAERKPVLVTVRTEFFTGGGEELSWTERRDTDEFTFGYALTVHKSQGSQWSNVLLFDESSVFRDDARRWLYTGLTRAAETLTVVRSAA